MAKAKRLTCNHLFHLSCLRSWYDQSFPYIQMTSYSKLMLTGNPNPRLDQGLNENYSCPTCRKPLFVGRPEHEVNPRGSEISGDEQLARQISAGLDRQNLPGHGLSTGIFPEQTQNPLEVGDWRSSFCLHMLRISRHCSLAKL